MTKDLGLNSLSVCSSNNHGEGILPSKHGSKEIKRLDWPGANMAPLSLSWQRCTEIPSCNLLMKEVSLYWWRKPAYVPTILFLRGEVVVKVRMRSGCGWGWQNLQATFRGFLSSNPICKGCDNCHSRWDWIVRTWWKGSGNNFQARHPLLRVWPQLPNFQIFPE